MARRVRWTHAAAADLEDVYEFIAKDSRFYAVVFVREAREAARSLKKMAERGRVVPELGDPSVRELLVGQYRLIYQLSSDAVDILGFIHGARDLKYLWKS